MRVTDEATVHAGSKAPQAVEGNLESQPVEKVFVRVARRAVRRQPAVAERRGAGQVLQIRHLRGAELLPRPVYRLPRPLVEVVVTPHAARRLVVIARNHDGAGLPDQAQACVRVGVVADDVAQADDGVRPGRCVVQHRLQGFEIGVQVGDNRVFHDVTSSGWGAAGSAGATSSVRNVFTCTWPGRAPRNLRTCLTAVYSTSTAAASLPLL